MNIDKETMEKPKPFKEVNELYWDVLVSAHEVIYGERCAHWNTREDKGDERLFLRTGKTTSNGMTDHIGVSIQDLRSLRTQYLIREDVKESLELFLNDLV